MFPLSCPAIDGFVAFLVALEACAPEPSLLFGVFSGKAFILAFVRAWGDFIERLRLLCPHEPLALIPSLNKISNFNYSGIFFACNAEVILYGYSEFAEQNVLTYSLAFESNACFAVFSRCLQKSEKHSCWGSYLSWSRLCLDISLKLFRAYSQRNIWRISLSVVSGVIRMVCQNSNAS